MNISRYVSFIPPTLMIRKEVVRLASIGKSLRVAHLAFLCYFQGGRMRPADKTGRQLVQKYVQRKFTKAARRDESQAAA